MKKIYLGFLTIVGFMYGSFAQVTVTGADAATNMGSPYATLSAAFTAINATAQTGNAIVIGITANITEPVGGASLNSGAWSSITIAPVGGPFTVSAAVTAGSPLINFNGADKVTINGGGNLTFSNTTASTTTGTSTIKFISDASNNIIDSCTILGSFTTTSGANGGNIFFSTATAGGTGNDNNIIRKCNIGPVGTTSLSRAIFSNGSTSSTLMNNSGNIIALNKIYDYAFSGTTGTSRGVDISTGNINWSITENKFYLTTTKNFNAGQTHSAIFISNTTNGDGFIVSNNIIGFANSTGTGKYTIGSTPATTIFNGIVLNGMPTASSNSITKNTIANIIHTTTSTSTGAGASQFIGINVGATSNINITENNINDIDNQITGNSSGTMTGIDLAGANIGVQNVNNNTIGNIVRTSTNTSNIIGIRIGVCINVNANNNTINNLAHNGIATTGAVFGIYSLSATTNETYNSNTITNLKTVGTSQANGIRIASAAGLKTIQLNNINNIKTTGEGTAAAIYVNLGTTLNISQNNINTLGDGASIVYGIRIGSPNSTSSIYKNNINNLFSSSTTPYLNGISVEAGSNNNVYNNFVSDIRTPNANATTSVYGINLLGGSNVGLFFNTVVLGKGSTLTSTGAHFGLTGIAYSNTVNATINNNIVWVDATPNGAGMVSAIKKGIAGSAGTSPLNTNFNSNNNIYFVKLATGTAPVAANINKYLYVEGDSAHLAVNGFGEDIGQVDNITQNLKSDINFNASCGLYKSFMGSRESATFTENNLNNNAGLTFIPSGACFAKSNGIPISIISIVDDFNGITRQPLTPDVGALEFAGTALADISGPTIVFNNLQNTACLSAPVLSALITDASGVNTLPGLAPRLYYRKAGATPEADIFGNYPADNNNTFNGWKYVEAIGSTPNFNFAINFGLLNSPMALGDSLTYFIVAQDLNGTTNVSKNSVTFASGFCPTSVIIPTLGAAPTTNSLGYKIIAFAPTYTILATSNYVQSLVNAQQAYINLAGFNGCTNNVTKVSFKTGTSINPAINILQAKCYYTTTTTFSTANPYGTPVATPSGGIVFNGSQTLANSIGNYFWLVYDISCAATVADSVNAEVTSIEVDGNNFIPTGISYAKRAVIALGNGDNIQTAPTVLIGAAGGNAYNITDKTIQPGEPSPIIHSQPQATNGIGTSNYSWGSAISNTQWYKLVVPTTGSGSSGNLLIRATTAAAPNDVQVALWKFPNMVSGTCAGVANFTDGYLLAANDDGIVNGTGYTGFATTNAVMRVRVTPGQTYYIQLDGFNATFPIGDLIVEDLADATGKNVSNNGFGAIHNPTSTDMRFASYEVIGDDGWTYYYNNNGTSTNIIDDVVLLGLNWSTSPTYLWKGISATGNDLMNHVRRAATSTTAPSAFLPGVITGLDAFTIWSGRNNSAVASNDLAITDGGYVLSPKWYMMNKFWNVFPNVQPTTSIGVRTFYSNADYLALKAAVTAGGGNLADSSAMEFIKATKSSTTHYSNVELDPGNGHGAITAGTVTALAWTNTGDVQPGIHQAQFNIATFSGGGGGSSGIINGVLLPIYLESFTATKQGNIATINWKVGATNTAVKYEVLKSTDGRNFNSLTSQNAINNVRIYNATDANLVNGANYYKLKATDRSGAITYSAVAVIYNNTKGFEIVSLIPTLVRGNALVSIGSDKATNATLIVTDMQGKTMLKKVIGLQAGTTNITIDATKFAVGAYILHAVGTNGNSNVVRFLKQ